MSRHVLDVGGYAHFLYRQAATGDEHSGWRVFAGGEDLAYCDDADNIPLCPLRKFIKRARRLESVLRAPVGSTVERDDCDGESHPVDAPGPSDHGA